MSPTKFRFNQIYGSGDVALFKMAFILDIETGQFYQLLFWISMSVRHMAQSDIWLRRSGQQSEKMSKITPPTVSLKLATLWSPGYHWAAAWHAELYARFFLGDSGYKQNKQPTDWIIRMCLIVDRFWSSKTYSKIIFDRIIIFLFSTLYLLVAT